MQSLLPCVVAALLLVQCHGVFHGDTAKQAQIDVDNYFAQEDLVNEIKNVEDYRARYAVEIATGHLPCEAESPMKLACESVMNVKRSMRGRTVTKSLAENAQLFEEPYRADDSRHFDVTASSTFTPVTSQTFDLHYADGSHLRGFSGEDMVTMGNFEAKAPFAVITDCNSPDFNDVDGILGFGLPRPGSNMPTPILFAMTDPGNADTTAGDLMRKFSFFSTDDAAEVQLGGYDPDTVDGTMWYAPSLSRHDFLVGVTSLKFGSGVDSSVELLQFTTKSAREYGLPSILDSGTSCLVIPGDTAGGKLQKKPWDLFAKHWRSDKSFYLKIAQKTYEIPASSWFLWETQQTCVQPSPSGMQGLLIGDVFFREFVVEFDMTEDRPYLGIAPLNKAYNPVTANQLSEYAIDVAPKDKMSLAKGKQTMYEAEHSDETVEVDRIPIVNSMGTQYFMDVAIGSPKQEFTVIFDTGSTVFGVFTWKDDLPQSIKDELPSYYFSQDLKQEARPAQKRQKLFETEALAMLPPSDGPSYFTEGAAAVQVILGAGGLLAVALLVLRRGRKSGVREPLLSDTP
eukprot:CAMPEP_0196725490 /NCGR_PEP_ID=MMETSP1091-20130531/7044_1 /TAXON_ID=302021 /ORGANISM="Rhodomonas sp., Strain CCMP768" /LENGTH=568 /DNA_ID=CAMNT_0042067781 /DNA_START=17 /DNA_END=1723 /DNA_ORIENTATION=-